MIPCKQCICYAICKQSLSIVDLIEQCCILSKSIKSLDDAVESIYIIEPPYLRECKKDGVALSVNSEAIYKAAYRYNYRNRDKNG